MISLPLPSGLIFEDNSPYTSGWHIRDDVMEWLLANVGPGNQYGGWCLGQSWQWNYRYAGKPINNVICFYDIRSAMLFKLTWGGS